MPPDNDQLSQIRIASPCTASWDEMRGDDRVRFCEHCRLNVYNLSAMSRPEAEALVRENEGRLCARFYERPDGTVLTNDCPVGFRAARRLLLARLGTIAAAFAAMLSSHFRWQPFMGVATMGSPAPLPEALSGVAAPPRRPVMGKPEALIRPSEPPMGRVVVLAPPGHERGSPSRASREHPLRRRRRRRHRRGI